VRRALVGVVCLAVAACGGVAKRAPTTQDVATIAASLSDIAYQCQSVAAGYVASVDGPSIRRDVDALLRVSRRVQPDARFTFGALHTTLQRELVLAQANLQGQSCDGAQARRLSDVAGGG
jgi:hypothetical protein